MRLHFVAELVLEFIYQIFDYPRKIGANITDNKAQILGDYRFCESFL